MRRGSRIIFLVALIVAWSSVRVIAQVDTVRNISDTSTEFHMTKSPTTAVLLSAALPGAGQVYLGQVWKVPIIAGLAGGFLYGALIQNSRYHEEAQNYVDLNAKLTAADSFSAQGAARRREFYRDDRDKWWIYLGLTYIANLLDAYIAANLYDFDVSDPAPSSKFRSYYDPTRKSFGLGLTLKF